MLSPSRSLLHVGQPVNLSSPLNRCLAPWWMVLPLSPFNIGGARTLDLCGKYHGTLTGGIWSGQSRVGGYGSIFLNGVNEYATLSPPATAIPLTISCWIRTTGTNGLYRDPL